MPGRVVTVALTDDQAALLDEIAAGRGADPAALLLEAVAHGLAMIAAGVDESDLQEPDPPDGVFRPALSDLSHKRRRGKAAPGGYSNLPGQEDDDIPF